MKPEQVYLKAAEYLDKKSSDEISNCCCFAIRHIKKDIDCENLFRKVMMPTALEKLTYQSWFAYCFYSYNRTAEQNRQDRVLALLFMSEFVKSKTA